MRDAIRLALASTFGAAAVMCLAAASETGQCRHGDLLALESKIDRLDSKIEELDAHVAGQILQKVPAQQMDDSLRHTVSVMYAEMGGIESGVRNIQSMLINAGMR